MNKKKILKDIAEIGIFVGIAIVLNFSVFKIKITATGGSISFVMIPLFIIAIRHTWYESLIAGSIIYGIPACLIGGHGFQYYPFDYMIAYGGIFIISIFKNKILLDSKVSYLYLIISILFSTLIRFISGCLSSMIYFKYNLVSALVYNAPYIFISGGIGLIALILLLKPLKTINKKYQN